MSSDTNNHQLVNNCINNSINNYISLKINNGGEKYFLTTQTLTANQNPAAFTDRQHDNDNLISGIDQVTMMISYLGLIRSR